MMPPLPLPNQLSNPADAPRQNRVVWIVEDDPKWQEAFDTLVHMALEEAEVHRATCEAETRHWNFEAWPDLVLMDWQLAHGDDGLNLLRRWIEAGLPETRVIVVSGSNEVPPHEFYAIRKSEAATRLIPALSRFK